MEKTNADIIHLFNEVLIRIFEYLPLDDIKSCRLVNKKWYLCCEDGSITDKEKFVFRGNMYTCTEINYILENTKRTNIHLELLCVKLKRLHFQEFGWKIRSLQITPSFEYMFTVRNILRLTPNMKHFHCILSSDHMLFSAFSEFLLGIFHWSGAEVANLETVVISGNKLNRVLQFAPGQLFYNIVPHLKAFYLLPPFYETRSIFKDDITELGGIFFQLWYNVNFGIPQCLSTNLPSKLKKLDAVIGIQCTTGPIDSSIGPEFLSHQTELEYLMLQLHCSKLKCSQQPNVKCPMTRLFLYILTICDKLKELRCGVDCSLNFHMDPDESSKFLEAASTSGLRVLEIPMITFDCDDCRLWPHLMLFKRLEGLSLFSINPLISYHVMIEELSGILGSQKNLHKFCVYAPISLVDDDADGGDVLPAARLHHDKLEHLELTLYSWKLVTIFLRWEFPQLMRLKLLWLTSNHFKSNIETKKFILEWICRMESLTSLVLCSCFLDIADCAKICQRLTRLQFFRYESLNLPTNDEVKDVFFSHSTLKELIVDVFQPNQTCNTTHFRINRTKAAVYARHTHDGSSYPFTLI